MRSRPVARLIAWVLVAVGLLAAIPPLLARHSAEAASRRVDLVAELEAFRQLSLQEGYPLDQLLRDLAATGITSVAVTEQNIDDARKSGDAGVFGGNELRSQAAAGAALHPLLAGLHQAGSLVDNHTYILPADRAVAGRMYGTLADGLPAGRVTWHQAGGADAGVIEIHAPPKAMEEWGLGYSEHEFGLVRAAGLRPAPRPRNLPQYTAAGVRRVFERLDELGPGMNSIIFYGKALLGYRPDDPAALQATMAEMERRGLALGGIEHFTQLGYLDQFGLVAAAEALDYRVTRVYALSQKEVDKYRPETSVDKWVKSTMERNIRTLYLRPFLQWQDPGQTIIETNLKYFGSLVSQLQAYGYPPGGPDVFAPVTVPWWQRGLMGWAAVGAGLLWLGLTWPVRQRWLLVLAVLGAGGSLAVSRVAPNTGAQLIALAAAILFPTAGAVLLLDRWGTSASRDLRPGGDPGVPVRSLWAEGAVAFLALGLLGLAGGLLVAALLGDIRYILEFRYFRGVKIAFAAPLLLVAASYLLMGRNGRPGQVVREVVRDVWTYLQVPIQYKHVAIGLVGAVGVFWYIQRSGNFPVVPVPDLERKVRLFLEHTLVARPRFKEFAIGYPALALAMTAAHRGLRSWVLPLMIVGATAGVSVVNSFSHLRTPVLMSLLRTVHGFWLGILAAVAVTAAFMYLVRWVGRVVGPPPGGRGNHP